MKKLRGVRLVGLRDLSFLVFNAEDGYREGRVAALAGFFFMREATSYAKSLSKKERIHAVVVWKKKTGLQFVTSFDRGETVRKV